jgi:hypothetical protein
MVQLQKKALNRNNNSIQLKFDPESVNESQNVKDKEIPIDIAGGYDTEEAAAEAFGRKFNGDSIKDGLEYGSSIFYRITEAGKKKFFFTEPKKGLSLFVRPSRPKNKLDRIHIVAFVHTHGKYIADRDWSKKFGMDPISKVDWNNTFSYSYDGSKKNEGDIEYFRKNKVNGYLIGPNGKMTKYNFLENEKLDPKPEKPVIDNITTSGIERDPDNP